jgi:G3E family GTPase
VVILPVGSTAEASLAAARDLAETAFAGPEVGSAPGGELSPGAFRQRLLLADEQGSFRLLIPAAGSYVVFEECGEVPLHIQVGGETVKPGWQQDYHIAHAHNDAVTSVGIQQVGELDGTKLNQWISELLRTQGGDIYRMKGVLSVKGSDRRLVFQGVHMLFDAKFDRAWGQDARENTLVFIGKNLDRGALTAKFRACLV